MNLLVKSTMYLLSYNSIQIPFSPSGVFNSRRQVYELTVHSIDMIIVEVIKIRVNKFIVIIM